MKIGVTTYSRDLPESDEKRWSHYLDALRKSGASHVQFLPPTTEKTAKMWGEMASDKGLDASIHWVSFFPLCPTVHVEKCLQAAKKAIDFSQIVCGKEGKLVTSPCFLRGLGDPNRGLPSPSDKKKQIAFLAELGEFTRKLPFTKLAVEPLNRFESRGPNTIRETVEMIRAAEAEDVLGILADTCHQGFEERPIGVTWKRYASHIFFLHASSLKRTFLKEDADLTTEAFSMASKHPHLQHLPLIVEAFCKETNPDFFSYLGLHQPPQLTAVKLFQENAKWLKQQVASR